MPNELIEASIVDGCSSFRTFVQIVFPLARNTVITIASMYSILIWNDYIFANTFISDSSAKTVAMGLKDYVGAFGNADCYVLRDLVIRMYWDGEENPSVESPLGDFFCCGFARECLVTSMPISVIPNRGFNCYFQMPFRKKAKITLENQHDNPISAFFYQIDYCLHEELPEETAYFHAQWRRQRITELQKDYVILDGVKGKGHYVGTYFALTTLERYWWGEGEVKFYIDGDEEYPTICGTGTEDYFGGSWSYSHQVNGRTVEQNYNSPFLGYPYYSSHDELIHNPYHNDDCPPMRGFYRWHILDPICFDEDLKVTIQQIGVCYRGLFERQDDVASVAYWYQSEPHQEFEPLMEKKERWPR